MRKMMNDLRKAALAASGVLLLSFPVCSSAQQQPSLADAAKKTRAQKKAQAKPIKVYTDDDLGSVKGEINVVGAAPAPAPAGQGAAAGQPAAAAATEAAKPKDEKDEKGAAYWRKRFAEARAKLRNAEKELDIMQRERNLNQQQYYSDPNKALQEQYTRKELNESQQKIADKKREIEQLRQAISDLEDELRRSGGDLGWSREQ